MSELYADAFHKLEAANPIITWAARQIVEQGGDTAALTEAKINSWGDAGSPETANALRFAVQYLSAGGV